MCQEVTHPDPMGQGLEVPCLETLQASPSVLHVSVAELCPL